MHLRVLQYRPTRLDHARAPVVIYIITDQTRSPVLKWLEGKSLATDQPDRAMHARLHVYSDLQTRPDQTACAKTRS